jgi:hypothetical protein
MIGFALALDAAPSLSHADSAWGSTAASASTDNGHHDLKFLVSLDGHSVATASQCCGGSIDEVIRPRVGEDAVQRRHLAAVKWADVTLKRGEVRDPGLLESWTKQIGEGRTKPGVPVEIAASDSSGIVETLELRDCYPKSYEPGGGGSASFAQLVITCEEIRLVRP